MSVLIFEFSDVYYVIFSVFLLLYVYFVYDIDFKWMKLSVVVQVIIGIVGVVSKEF